MTTKSLSELAVDYAHALKLVDEQIDDCRLLIDRAKKARKNLTVFNLSRKLSLLYDQRSELKETFNYLSTYYDKQQRCAG